MASRKRSHSRRRASRKQELHPLHRFARFAGFVVFLVIAAYFITNIFARTNSCVDKTSRPCYDKTTGTKVSLLGKNAANTFDACINNSAPNNVGEFIIKTNKCEQEKVTYCHDGKSANFLRKFSGDCLITPPPPPPPTPEPTPSPTPTSTPNPSPTVKPFRITYPNGGEQIPYGSDIQITWEGGDTINNWPVNLMLIDKDRWVTLRELTKDLVNDGVENWVVDVPLGTYYMMYGQGCRYASCSSQTQWDYGDAKFNVVQGPNPVEKVSSSYPTNQSLVMLAASGGEVWEVGSTQTIKWTGASPDSIINISLLDETGQYGNTRLFTGLVNDGSETWTVPGYIPPGTYRMYVDCSNCSPGKYAYGYYPFTIK